MQCLNPKSNQFQKKPAEAQELGTVAVNDSVKVNAVTTKYKLK